MKIFRTAFVILFCAALICLDQIVIACSDGDYEDRNFIFFPNYMNENKVFKPFYYAPYIQYYDDWDEDKTSYLTDVNLKEWVNYGAKKFTLKDANDFIYKFSYSDLHNIYYHLEQAKPLKLVDSVRKNTMTAWFLNNKDLEALGYLMYAKQCEATTSDEGGWERKEKNVDLTNKLIKNGKQLKNAAKSDFFQWRYAYQIIRQAFYLGEYKQTLTLYQELIGDKKADNIAYFRSLANQAGAYYHLENYNLAAYLYSQVFNGTDDNKKGIYISYNWCFKPHGEYEGEKRASSSNVMKMAKNDEEKAVLHLMNALNNSGDGVQDLRKIYSLAPSLKGLDVLMNREINKMEMAYLDYYDTPIKQKSAKELLSAKDRIKHLVDFGKMVSEKKSNQAAYWNMAVSYLYYLDKDLQNCKVWIAKAEAANPSVQSKNMLQLEKLLITIAENPKMTAQSENYILPALKWLEQQASENPKLNTAFETIVGRMLYNKYQQQGDSTTAILLAARSILGPSAVNARKIDPGYFKELTGLTEQKILSLKAKILNKNSSAFDTWLVKNPPFQNGALDLYLGTQFLLNHEFKKSISYFTKVPVPLMDKYRFEDPFLLRWKDRSTEDGVGPYTKLRFAEEMLKLKNSVDNNNADAKSVYKYATGLYAMTYYGVAWSAGIYFKSTSDELAYYNHPDRKFLTKAQSDYYSANSAFVYFRKALEKAEDKETKANCTFMLAKCWQKNITYKAEDVQLYSLEDNNYFKYAIKNPYLSSLYSEFKNSRIYPVILEDCSYLKHFVAKQK